MTAHVSPLDLGPHPVGYAAGIVAFFAVAFVAALVIERTISFARYERMNPVAAFVRAVLSTVVGGPLRLHQRRMAAVAQATAAARAHAMLRHPSAQNGYRHLRSVPDQVA